MNAALQNVDTQLKENLLPLDSPQTIKKTDLLQYYRETQQDFLNLGSMLFSLRDRKLYIFSKSGELSDVTTLEA